MYDALLDDLEDDRTPNTDEAVELADKTAETDDEVPDDVACELDVDEDGDSKAEDLLLAVGEDHESWSDDPVRMYLTQMGEIPLLTRQQEISLAKEIEITRARFRRKLLECDYVIQYAVKVLKRVYLGELPFDRTVQVSVTDRLEKDQILGRFPHNLKTVETLLAQQARLSPGHQEIAADQRAPRSLAPLGPSPAAGRAPGRRAGLAHAAHRVQHQDPGRVQPPRGRAQGANRSQPQGAANPPPSASRSSRTFVRSCGQPRNRRPACGAVSLI